MTVPIKRSWLLGILCILQMTIHGLHAYGAEKPATPVVLTNAERSWLQDHPVITLAPDPYFKPIEYFDQKGNYQGAAADIVRLLEKRIGITITIARLKNWDTAIAKFKNHEVDLLGAMVKTPNRDKFALFTSTIVSVPGGIFTRSDNIAPLTLAGLRGKKVAVVSNYTAHDVLRKDYPDVILDVVPDVATGLAKASLGMVDAFVENMANATFYCREAGITNLRLAGKTDFVYRWRIGIRQDWPELQGILNKGLASISEQERQQFMERYIYIEGMGWRPSKLFIAGIVAALFGVSLLFVVYWNYTLRKRVRGRTASLQLELGERQRAETALRNLTGQLEARVNERTSALEEKVVEHTAAEAAARASELKFREVFENVADPIYISDMSGKIITANNQACLELGYTHAELLTKGIVDLDVIDNAPEKIAATFQNFANTDLQTFETLHRRKDGTIFPVEVRACVIDFDGRQAVLGIARNITERKNAEQALRQANLVVENSPVVLFRWQAIDGWPVDMVSQNVGQFGYTQEELLSGTVPFVSLIHPEDLARVEREVQEYSASGTERFQQEYRLLTKNGEVRWVDDRTMVERDKEGQIAFYQGIFIDITERKLAEAALQSSLAEKEFLLKEVHHRVKNNLQIISSLLHLQGRKSQNPEVHDILQETMHRVRSMALLHETLYRSGNFAKVDFSQYVKGICTYLARSYGSGAENIRLRQDIAEVAMDIDKAIPAGLIISELVTNAFKHAFPAQSNGKIVVELAPHGTNHLILRVSDNGIGFPAETHWQKTETLGLSLVQNLSRQLDGQMSLASEQGSVFELVFPVQANCEKVN